ncbi:MAG: hypothetical protein F6K10_43840 [Moorea sp. SIO2B7]|nr:hypothetical protein [Moorena sp. SIO2B7]
MENFSILSETAKSIINNVSSRPSPCDVVEALLEAEKTAKKKKITQYFEQLLGNWRLCFITGTKKTRQRAGIVLGAGRYIPKFVKITISYSASEQPSAGRVENVVEIGLLKLSVTGPVKFLPKKNILAFDFTKMKVQVLGAKLYEGYIRGGKAREQQFEQESIGKQAFFAYFLLEYQIIAARGRGGGLALWGRETKSALST